MAKPQPGQVQRCITLRLYPNAAQQAVLLDRLRLHAELYNAAIEERREAYRLGRHSRTYYDQQNQLPAIKARDQARTRDGNRPGVESPVGGSGKRETATRLLEVGGG